MTKSNHNYHYTSLSVSWLPWYKGLSYKTDIQSVKKLHAFKIQTISSLCTQPVIGHCLKPFVTWRRADLQSDTYIPVWVGICIRVYTASYPRRSSSYSPSWEPQISHPSPYYLRSILILFSRLCLSLMHQLVFREALVTVGYILTRGLRFSRGENWASLGFRVMTINKRQSVSYAH
jgi:hypothetical protein